MTPVSETFTGVDLNQLCINTIRTLSMDAVQQAKSGHPGTPMALRRSFYTLWNRVMRFDPQIQSGQSDRFVRRTDMLDAALVRAPPDAHSGRKRRIREAGTRFGHPGDIRRFRQLDSKAPGHPEYHWVSVWKPLPVRSGRVVDAVVARRSDAASDAYALRSMQIPSRRRHTSIGQRYDRHRDGLAIARRPDALPERTGSGFHTDTQ